ncbi:ABC transporter ATP-binding protein [Oenococcus sicerae]|uniref:ABC transporter ATP-binding protein n=1 Tax=Oenococcus sicerae TaxID=2203724 RepID=A0AAJ1R9V5_9LACO|nr:ABC transporter ATP-binding protein [Oenococcus sicerae]MDN6900422.1 ABC transporter ATP-binding protein [Oenococcus sicerae]QAS69558.1 ABC transporter ATP-binding protein [Oenococcus sicerae]
MEKLVEMKNVKKTYNGRVIIEDVDLTFAKGSFTAIVGESGGGKTTLLRMISGLEKVTEGSIEEHGQIVHGLNETTRIMFQNGRLLPWKTVLENVMLGSEKSETKQTLELLNAVGLKQLAQAHPVSLSGGEQQRVALARALISGPELLLLDEPLGALDALTRINMQKLIEKIWQEYHFTAILVTHDVEEAVRLADHVVVVSNHHIRELIDLSDFPRPREMTDKNVQKKTEDILNIILKRQTQ